MASLDFDTEKKLFREYYELNIKLLENAKNSFITLITALLSSSGNDSISKIEGRVKEKEECIKKFNLKYRSELETQNTPYSIQEKITDLIGLRIICLYEDDVEKINSCLSTHFDVIDITNKITQLENTEASFGYKGLHLDLKLNEKRIELPEYEIYKLYKFEVQIRTIIQDSWSVLDHKIKYKKSIPNRLKRRINTLAELFELADREFREIRESTIEEIRKEETIDDTAKDGQVEAGRESNSELNQSRLLNAFSFQKIAHHFFKDYEFEAHKVDGFTQEIIEADNYITRGKLNFLLRENIGKAKRYQNYFEKNNKDDKLNPYTLIRHCLYLGDKDKFSNILTSVAKDAFDNWLSTNAET
ncbi:GTP pyrophosphokinase [Janthinobacterium sp. ZB1P44]|uniref:GTP pyrophosphokinase n=1 Tax=Janthinobacterium sp. ZB1P44 TaxID=3424192 RepID=UPI003F289260